MPVNCAAQEGAVDTFCASPYSCTSHFTTGVRSPIASFWYISIQSQPNQLFSTGRKRPRFTDFTSSACRSHGVTIVFMFRTVHEMLVRRYCRGCPKLRVVLLPMLHSAVNSLPGSLRRLRSRPNCSTPRTENRFSLHDLDLFRAKILPI